jgi:hypothetical protein
LNQSSALWEYSQHQSSQLLASVWTTPPFQAQSHQDHHLPLNTANRSPPNPDKQPLKSPTQLLNQLEKENATHALHQINNQSDKSRKKDISALQVISASLNQYARLKPDKPKTSLSVTALKLTLYLPSMPFQDQVPHQTVEKSAPPSSPVTNEQLQ